jgi:hypothetical protein
MRTCQKRSDRSNTRPDELLRDVRTEETWKANKERGEGFSDSFSYFGNVLQRGFKGRR